MAERPTGTVTFLFTDVERSTRLWEDHPAEMRVALERHDVILRSAIEDHGGYVFSTAGDAFAASFARAGDAVAASVEAQLTLSAEQWPDPTTIRVRMGLHTGEAQERGGDYFGPVLNRAARVMSAGHGGQILVGASTTAVVDGVDLVDLGEHRLKDLSAGEHLFQVRAGDLESEFPPLRTVDATPGNLPVQSTSFVGRDHEVKELSELVRSHRMVTLTGVGGVGKSRLAVQVAAELSHEYTDGIWLVELAPVGDPASVPDAVATVLGVTPQAGRSMTESLAEALSGRRLLLILDNCEHVLGAAAELVETILARASTVNVIATSREGLSVAAERLWSVPSLDVGAGADSAAFELFVERAGAVVAGFSLSDEADRLIVTEICQRLDGIALAIELAAARMVSMSPTDVRDRLGDRFRLLSGGRQGLERHQTLRHAVGWSYDLLDGDERALLDSCAVFADGFDLAAVIAVCDTEAGFDEYQALDILDSLVRKSLITVDRAGGHARYGLLETIRQFAQDQLVASDVIGAVQDRHARYFADLAVTRWEIWDGPRQREAVDWVDVEFANLRAAFRWATDRDDAACATAIAAHTTMLIAYALGRYESVGWAEEILETAVMADVAQLPRLYVAASNCLWIGRQDQGIAYAHKAVELEGNPRYDPFETGWSSFWEATAYQSFGQFDEALEISEATAAQPGPAHAAILCQMLLMLPTLGRVDEAIAIADECTAATRARGNPLFIAYSLLGCSRAFAETDPARAMTAAREGLDYTRAQRLPYFEAILAREAGMLEAVHGDLAEGLNLFDSSIEFFYRSGNFANLAFTLGSLTVLFERLQRHEIAATTYGGILSEPAVKAVMNLKSAVDHLRSALGDTVFDQCVTTGGAMELGEIVAYAREGIQATQILS